MATTQMTLLERYIAGWRTPVYRGHAWVKRWIEAWFAENGRVI